MKTFTCLVGLLVLCVTTAEVRAGGPPPVCMAVDKLVFEPNEDAPTRIQIWGSFALLNDRREAYGNPVRGYMYYTAPPGKDEECRKEWAKLKKLVAEQHLVSFGMCGEPKVDVHHRKPTDKLETPVAFPLAQPGFLNADDMRARYPALKQLRTLSESQKAGAGAKPSNGKTDSPSK